MFSHPFKLHWHWHLKISKQTFDPLDQKLFVYNLSKCMNKSSPEMTSHNFVLFFDTPLPLLHLSTTFFENISFQTSITTFKWVAAKNLEVFQSQDILNGLN